MKLIIASNNAHKLEEIKAILGSSFEEILSLREAGIEHETIEDGASFAENAAKKAREITELSGCCALADDSGLCVDALGGAPGVYSARYSGLGDRGNIDKLLSELKDTEEEFRTARFVCVMTAVFPDGRVVQARGQAEGVILWERRGEDGFGYDPVFYYPPLCRTFAELTAGEKNMISHRARAIAAFCPMLKKELLK